MPGRSRQDGQVTPVTPSGPQIPGPSARREASSWVESTRSIRWGLALLLTLGALAVFAYWLAAGQHLACQVVTVTSGAANGRPAQAMTTQTCGLPDVADFAYVLAAVAVLLLPDAQSIKIGGFEFDRLSSKLDQQTQEISQLRQTISTTINIGSDLINQARNGFSETKDVLDRVRAFLPDTPEVRRQLATIDDLARRIDSESWPDLFVGIITMHGLIEEAGRVTASAVVRTTEGADTAEEEAQAEEADTVLSDYLGDTGTASEGRS